MPELFLTEYDITCAIALTQMPGIGAVTTRQLLTQFGTPSAIFGASRSRLLQTPGVGTVVADTIVAHKTSLAAAEDILQRCKKKNIKIALIAGNASNNEAAALNTIAYPSRLREIPDAPALLYVAGKQPAFDARRMVAIVGTRKNTAYGRKVTERTVAVLAKAGVEIISGLAFGIDTIAHKAALEQGTRTHAIVATGPDKVYPSQNKELAMRIFEQGAIVSEYPPGTKADTRFFPARNRIIAGLVDAIIVPEAVAGGGSLITARLGLDYNREVYSTPGSIFEPTSQGCNELIQANGAAVFTSPEAFLEEMRWADGLADSTSMGKSQLWQMPENLSKEEQVLLTYLRQEGNLHIDDLSWKTELNLNQLASLLLTLEFAGHVRSYPGKKFGLTTA
jgi:DNA processing protein